MPRVTMSCGKGMNRDQPPFELEPGVWSDLANVRTVNGAEEPVGGMAAIHTPSVTPYWLGLYQTSSTRYIIEAGIAKVYSYDGTNTVEITRNVDSQTMSSVSTPDLSPSEIVKVTTGAAHNLTTGDTIAVYGTTNCDGTAVNGTFAVTVTAATTFEYDSNILTTGFGAGTPGFYKVTNSATVKNFTGAVDDRWSGGNLNGTFILSNPVDGLYSWNGSGRVLPLYESASSSTRIGYVADASRVFRDFVVQIAPTISATKYPYRILWSDLAEPGALPTAFEAATDNLAGNVDKTEAGPLIDGSDWGGYFYVYGLLGRIRMRYLPDTNDVFEFVAMPDKYGLWARGCIANTPVGQVFLSSSKDVMIHEGGAARSIAEGRVKKWLADNLDTTYGARAFLSVNPKFKEVWVNIPTTGNTACNRVLIWNWESNTWGDRTVSGVTYMADGLVPTSVAGTTSLVVSTTTPRVGLVESGTTDFGSAITATMERTGIHLDNRTQYKLLTDSRPSMDAAAAVTATVYHGSSAFPDTAPTYISGVTYTQGTTNLVNGFASENPYLAWKLSTTGVLRLRTVELLYEEGGDF